MDRIGKDDSTPNRKKTETFRCKSKKRTQTNPSCERGWRPLNYSRHAHHRRCAGQPRAAARRGASQRRAAARRRDAGGALVRAPKGTTEVPLDGAACGSGRTRAPARGATAAPPSLALVRTRRPRLLRCAARRTEQHMRAVRPGHGCSVPRWPVRTARRDERRRRRQHERGERRNEIRVLRGGAASGFCLGEIAGQPSDCDRRSGSAGS